ncbi:MAG: hypothetical protein ACE37F_06935 [Nannocystaceae bacterium]|nr:hypothetical protein [bacterium]
MIGLVLLALGGCKVSKTQAPGGRLDDIAAIESELAANAARLESQGVVVTVPPASPGEDEVDGADASPKPAVGPPPEPAPEAEPVPSPTDAPVTLSEESDDDADFESVDRSPGYAPTRQKRKKSLRGARRDEQTRCERICDLADNTCDLADKICALADEHVDDVRYEDACDRAEAQCEAASDACAQCED